MKKNILKTTLVATFALLAGYNVYNSQKSDVMSDLALANVEALADDNQIENYHGFSLYDKPMAVKFVNAIMMVFVMSTTWFSVN